MKEQGVVDVSKMDNTVEDISNESSGGLEESREENLQVGVAIIMSCLKL